MPERQVDDVHSEAFLVRCHEFDRADHITGRACAVLIENLERDNPRLRRDASISLARRQIPAPCDEARYVSAMPVVICGWCGYPALREIVEPGDPVTEFRPWLQPGVDHGHTDAIASWRLHGQRERAAQCRVC